MSDFIQLVVSGVALGCLYALVALSFVIVLRATGVFNIVQGGVVLFSAYLVYDFHVSWGLPFGVALLLTVILCTAAVVLLDRVLFRPITSHGSGHGQFFAVLLVGVGLLTVCDGLVVAIWGSQPLSEDDPWGLSKITLGSIALTSRDLSVIGITLVLLLAFWYLLQRTRIGVGMRAVASDPEAARVQGINPAVISAVAWICATIAAVLAGVMLGTAVGGGINSTIDQVSFLALPALILGGAGSIGGCVLGGIVLGVLQSLAAGYAPASFGSGFGQVVPWVVMIIILVIRPSGLLGSRQVRRA
ncbi:MAG TPA: branched-chain amino acid ABC transporter permease [Trebonia sp.]|jgi:branched-chain amino acid transport system permease protein